MTDDSPSTDRWATIHVDQFIAARPATVWRTLTEPDLVARWWAAGDIAPVVGHEFTLDMPGFGAQPCRVLEADPPNRFVYTFTANWTLTWTLVAEGTGTRLFLDHSGFDLDDSRMASAFERMGPGWRDTVLPRLATVATT
ncbi:SRPBCC domain-containing protein [Gordonia sp. CPCC 206044]|uniref:SRPBCC family protein n=1 Tax=Gordonia sp. CPCC 206044 TaxID=3140793 RepID=UPI003AF3F2EF